jgi:hypothetical protein
MKVWLTRLTYLSASLSQHVIVKTESDASGNLTAQSLTFVPASSVVAVAGIVDATPAVSNSTVTGTPSTFSVHGIAVSADPAVFKSHAMGECMRLPCKQSRLATG